MKKFISFCLIIILLSSFTIPAFASQIVKQEEVVYLDNGDYLEIIISESMSRSTKSGNKVYTYKNAAGEALWRFVLSGEYNYDGSTSTCTAASCSAVTYSSNWSVSSKYAYRSGNTAYASVTMVQTQSGTVVSQPTYKLSLTCDKNGNLS